MSEVLLPPNIDGPINEYGRSSPSILALNVQHQILDISLKCIEFDPNNEKGQAFRIASWVEGPEEQFGRVMSVSRPNDYNVSAGTFTATSFMFTVDRHHRKVIEGPKILDSSMRTTHAEDIHNTLEAYDRQDMCFALGILDKMNKALFNEDYKASLIDNDVKHGLIDEYMHTLARNHPSPSQPPIVEPGRPV